jgi:hypothetical protein
MIVSVIIIEVQVSDMFLPHYERVLVFRQVHRLAVSRAVESVVTAKKEIARNWLIFVTRDLFCLVIVYCTCAER